MRTAPILAALIVLCSSPAFAWGPEGHAVVAGIAARHLTPGARRQVEILLDGPAAQRMPAVASWADWQGRAHPETKPWHYVDIEMGSAGYVAARDCEAGDCVVGAIAREEAILRDGDRDARADAVRWLIHLAGDIGQPLHCADRHDRGGNGVPVEIGEYKTNLHRVWDGDEVYQLGEDPAALTDALDRAITPAQRKRWGRGTPEDWADEGFVIARDQIYARLPPPNADGTVALTPARLKADAPSAAEQLQKSGLRLAAILNRVLR